MDKNRKIGIILILIGLCLPLVLWPFASGYNPRLGTLGSINYMALVLKEGKYESLQPESLPQRGPDYVPPFPLLGAPVPPAIAIPYKYPLAIGIILTFTGIAIVVLSKSNNIQ